MRPTKVLYFIAVSAMTALLTVTNVKADDVTESEYEEHARVMRVSLLRGEVSLKRAGNVEWERAKLNLPLVEGDTLATATDSRLEIQVDAYNFVRIGADSVVQVVALRDAGVAVSLSEGTATLRLTRFDKEREYFEIDAPKTTVAAEKKGLYRVDVSRNGDVRVTVRDDGRARVYSENSGFALRNNRTARLYYDGGESDWELSSAPAFDEWDTWIDERERFLASRLRYENRERYYDQDVWGAEELDAYGDWHHTAQYGWVWRPHITVINNYHNWAPYRYGHWRWCPPYGWTWVGDEDWGWAPYHYGRWIVYNNNWCWAPRGYGYNYRRAWWRPALVAFVYIPTSYGEHVAWYPLRHGQYDPHGRWWRQNPERLAPLRAREIANLERANPILLRAVTSVPAREFGGESLRARPATTEVARRAFTGEPVRGRLPITPANVGRTTTPGQGRVGAPSARAGANGSKDGGWSARGESLTIVRPAPVTPARAVPERNTGAASRTPGIPLDGELRRLRVLNGREPRSVDSTSEGDGRGDDRNTGVVARPARPSRPLPAEREGGSTEGSTGIRANRPTAGGERRAPSAGVTIPPERVDPVGRDRDDDEERNARPSRPVRRYEDRPAQPPSVYERPQPRERARPETDESRPTPQPRRMEPPPQREERPAPREERPPQHSAPPQRHEPPPQRHDPPLQRHDPPPAPRQEERQAPPPQRSEPRERPAPPARIIDRKKNPEVDP